MSKHHYCWAPGVNIKDKKKPTSVYRELMTRRGVRHINNSLYQPVSLWSSPAPPCSPGDYDSLLPWGRNRGRESERRREGGSLDRERERMREEEFWLYSFGKHYFQPPKTQLMKFLGELTLLSPISKATVPHWPSFMLTPHSPTAT